MKRTFFQRLKGNTLCQLFDHDWPMENGAFVVNDYALLHCKRCREEFYGRTFEDLRPLDISELSPAEQQRYYGGES